MSENDCSNIGDDPIELSEICQEITISEKIAYTSHIIDTHFQTFNWLDIKMQALLGIAAASLAVATFAIKDLIGLSVYENLAVITACIFLIAGMISSLIHLIPILDSGVGNIDNPRVAICIAKITERDIYHDMILNISNEDMLRYNCFQIYGLATICKTGYKRLRSSIQFVGGGLIIIAITLFIWGVRSSNFLETQPDKKPPVELTLEQSDCLKKPHQKAPKAKESQIIRVKTPKI